MNPPRRKAPRKPEPTPPVRTSSFIGRPVTPRPVALITDHHLDSGLVDYGMWVERCEGEGTIAPGPDATRRGRIWS
ncbi:hypothetical protein [Kineosporia sp. NBRC 101731]|uniref:hypothetical protein n=1 Tax=Kineosporia sp. NBRC 101731 TaxID=3032199 RepID=UPI0024A3F144|nr:hypothetical protein [Kineosporia sp. NBRC 101731]GLY30752.1 hypothetical protein Kisp02_41170 [Kineosporia sp. NBRC 101731]